MIGTFWPIRILASSLSSVIRLGVDSTLTEPSEPSAERIAPRPVFLLNTPKLPPFRLLTLLPVMVPRAVCAAVLPMPPLPTVAATTPRFRMLPTPLPKLVPPKP